MEQLAQPFDEYLLAAFLADTLPDAQRHHVAAQLADSAEARELMCMAYEMMETPVADEPLSVLTPVPDRGALSAPMARRMPRPTRFAPYLALAVLIFSLGVTLRLAMNPAPDALRSQSPMQPHSLAVEVVTPALQVQWTPVPDAYTYRLVIWDPQAARVVAEHETAATLLSGDDPFIQELYPMLGTEQSYTLRIDAIDARNRLLESSELVRFRVQ